MKTSVIAAVLLVLAVPADARMRHDRICDIAQERVNQQSYNPDGGNAVMFGPCEKAPEVLSVEASGNRNIFWNTISCGYRAYREGKKLTDNPYRQDEQIKMWRAGWKYARLSCTTGRLPTFEVDDIKD